MPTHSKFQSQHGEPAGYPQKPSAIPSMPTQEYERMGLFKSNIQRHAALETQEYTVTQCPQGAMVAVAHSERGKHKETKRSHWLESQASPLCSSTRAKKEWQFNITTHPGEGWCASSFQPYGKEVFYHGGKGDSSTRQHTSAPERSPRWEARDTGSSPTYR